MVESCLFRTYDAFVLKVHSIFFPENKSVVRVLFGNIASDAYGKTSDISYFRV